MQLPELSSAEMLTLQENVARAIADVDGFNYRQTFSPNDRDGYKECKSQMDHYMVRAKAAIAAMKTFGV